VTCTDGAGAPREDRNDDPTGHALRHTRRDEQRAAARRGRYSAAVQLDHPSDAVRSDVAPEVVRDLANVLDAARPKVVYTHSPTDQHPTHVGVCVAALAAIRSLPAAARPDELLGCEVWGGLDWLPEDVARELDLGADPASWSALIQVFASQTKARPYHEGALGRSRANAVFRDAHGAGGGERLWRAIDLTPLVQDDSQDLADFVRSQLAGFERSVLERIAAARGGS
jgi:LmbE family N-acetylglucosaminyl deacetylase